VHCVSSILITLQAKRNEPDRPLFPNFVQSFIIHHLRTNLTPSGLSDDEWETMVDAARVLANCDDKKAIEVSNEDIAE
jgi:hypothetical protein